MAAELVAVALIAEPGTKVWTHAAEDFASRRRAPASYFFSILHHGLSRSPHILYSHGYKHLRGKYVTLPSI